MPVTWNPWHGCKKISAGCQNCYVYRMDEWRDQNGREVKKNSTFYLPIKRTRNKEYKIPPGDMVYTCFTSDFLLDEADEWRIEAWDMIRQRQDLHFLFITKRIDRLHVNLPEDWGAGYDNVTIGCTTENQDRADYRLPIFLSMPIKHRIIICEPLLTPLNLTPYLTSQISEVIAGGESGNYARVCDYDWILDIRRQCIEANVPFRFKQTGARLRKDGKIYRVLRRHQHSQARKANINFHPKKEGGV